MKKCYLIFYLTIIVLSHNIADAQQHLAQQAYTIFEQHCLDCHGEFGSYADVLTIKHSDLIEDKSVLPHQPDVSELYLRLLGDTDNGSQMPLGQEPLDDESISTIRRWIEAGAPDWDVIPKPKRNFITTESMLKSIHIHVTSLSDFDRSFARYFTLTHLYNAGATDANLRAYRIALSKLINSLSWGAGVITPKPIDREETIFYIDLRNYEWDLKTDKWYKIEQAYPYGVQLKSATYTTLCQETDCELPFIRADWFIATASLPPLYHDILDLPNTDKELETQLEVNVSENLKNAPGVRVWRAGFSESGVSVNNRIVERHKSRYGAYWKSYDFAGNVGKQNIFTHPLDFTHDGGEIIFSLPNGLQAYYLSTDTGERLDEAPINIVSDSGSRDPVVRNGLSCMGCHTEGMKTFADQVRSVIVQNSNPPYDKAQALRLYAEKSTIDALIREDIARYRQAIAAAGGVFGGSEPIQQLVKQFEGQLDAAHAAAEVGLETDDFLKEIREKNELQNTGLLVFGVENGTVKRDAWESEFGTVISGLNVGLQIVQTTKKSKELTESLEDGSITQDQASSILQDNRGAPTPQSSALDLAMEYDIVGQQQRTGELPQQQQVPIQKSLEQVEEKIRPIVEQTNAHRRMMKIQTYGYPKLTLTETLDTLIKMPDLPEKDRVNFKQELQKLFKNSDKIIEANTKWLAKSEKDKNRFLQSIGSRRSPTASEIRKARQRMIDLNVNGHPELTLSYTNMAMIPAGNFRMGSNDGEEDEKPVHTVYIDAFYIDKYEVTNAQYKKFLDANPQWRKGRFPQIYLDGNYLKDWNGNNYPDGKGNHPVVNVSWYGAMAYAKWMGKRLPTEAEWEKAARGGLSDQKYPWGNTIDPSNANYYRSIGDTTSVGQYAPNAYGLFDMAGNVSEWCLDGYHKDFYTNSPTRDPVKDGNVSNLIQNFLNVNSTRVLRGGSWNSQSHFVRVANRLYSLPSDTHYLNGFRCVKDVKR